MIIPVKIVIKVPLRACSKASLFSRLPSSFSETTWDVALLIPRVNKEKIAKNDNAVFNTPTPPAPSPRSSRETITISNQANRLEIKVPIICHNPAVSTF